MRNWLLTWRTYGTWLPGDERGFVGKHQAAEGPVLHNTPGTRMDGRLDLLRRYAASKLKSEPVGLTLEQAEVLKGQSEETSRLRRWRICAGAILVNHVHLALMAPGGTKPERLLGDMKAYGSRALNLKWMAVEWWAQGGSKRHVLDRDLPEAIAYVLGQEHPLLIWRDAKEPRA